MSPADQPQAIDCRRSDPPTLWLSLGLGSVLIHLVFFIVISVGLTRTANVQLETGPIAVEFVDPQADSIQTRSTAPSQAIAARPGTPSSINPSATQAQPNTARSLPSAINAPVEQPFAPQPVQRKRLPARIRQPQPQLLNQPAPTLPNTANRPTQPQPNLPRNIFPQTPGSSEPGQPQPSSSSSQERLPGVLPNPSGSSEPPSAGSSSPADGKRISQGPQGDSIIVTVSNPRQPTADVQQQAAQPIDQQKNVSIRYSPALAQQTIRLEATLTIDRTGLVLSVEKAILLSSSGGAIDEATLNDLANQIFTQWRFKPAQDNSNGNPAIPPLSNLIIDAQVQLP